MRRCRIGCCFDFFYRRNVENTLLTRFDSLSVDMLTGCSDLLVRQSFEFACAAVTHLNRIYLRILNRDRCPQLNRPTRRVRSYCHDPDQFPCNRGFLVRRLGARSDAHTSEIKMATRCAKRILHLPSFGPSLAAASVRTIM